MISHSPGTFGLEVLPNEGGPSAGSKIRLGQVLALGARAEKTGIALVLSQGCKPARNRAVLTRRAGTNLDMKAQDMICVIPFPFTLSYLTGN